MTLEEIRKNAPSGATHYAYSNGGNRLHYLKSIDGVWHQSYFDDVYNMRTWILFIFIFIEIKPLH